MDEIEFTLLDRWTIGTAADAEALALRLLTTAGEQIDILLPLEAAEGIAAALARAAGQVRSRGKLHS